MLRREIGPDLTLTTVATWFIRQWVSATIDVMRPGLVERGNAETNLLEVARFWRVVDGCTFYYVTPRQLLDPASAELFPS